MDIRDLLSTSSESLKRNRARSVLTILGIVIGIAAVILMLSVGRSAENLILSQVADLGSDLVFVEPSSGDPTAGPPDPFVEQSLDLDDVKELEDSGFFTSVSPVLISSFAVEFEELSEFYSVNGVNEEYTTVFPADIEFGRDLTEADIDQFARVAVIGIDVAEELFGDQDPIGKKITVKDTRLTVVGVFPPLGSRFFQNLDQQINVPITTVQRITGIDHVTYISMRAEGDIEIAKDEARFILRDSHDIDNPEGIQDKDDFFVSSQDDATEIIGVVGNVLTLLLASVAAISLVVGGIGIMNIMLVSVTERTKEIGLRKSIGAQYKEILQQFLMESILLTLIGGLLGVIIGVVAAYVSGLVVSNFVAGWSATIPISGIILGLVVATGVGLIFGIYPARRAAKLDPIEALRYE